MLHPLLFTLIGLVFALSLSKSYVSVSRFSQFWQTLFDVSQLQASDSYCSIS